MAAGAGVGAALTEALAGGGGLTVWQAGTLWKCPGCGDRTVKTEEFLEGMQRAESCLRSLSESREDAVRLQEDREFQRTLAALAWLDDMAVRMLGCERDRVYIKDESGGCAYERSMYTSRI